MDIEHYGFCELAPLYILELLSEQERLWVEQHVIEYPDCAEELLNYQFAVAAIPYSAPVSPIDSRVKHRLFDRLDLADLTPAAILTRRSTNSVAFRARELNWQPHTTPGVRVAIVHQDEVKREIVGFLQAEPGVCYPWHRHAAVEEILMIEGDLVIGDEVYGAGDYIRSNPGSSHAPYTRDGCRFFFRTSLDDEYPG